MNLKKVALAVVAAAGLSTAANAATVVSSDPGPGLETTEISQTLTLGKFDGSLGILTGVTLTINTEADTIISLTNNAMQTQTARANASVDIDVASDVAALNAILAGLNPVGQLTFTTGNRVIAAGGTYTSPLLVDTDVDVFNLLGIGGALTGGAGDTFTLTCTSLSGLAVIGGGGNIGASQATRAGCGAEIVYEYRERTQVPEPATLGLLGLVLGGIGLAGRRARAA